MAESFRDTAFVMDSGSLLAYLRNDAGGALVQRVLRQCSDCETQVEIAAPVLRGVFNRSSRIALVSGGTRLYRGPTPIHVEPATHDRVIGVAQVIVEHPNSARPGGNPASRPRQGSYAPYDRPDTCQFISVLVREYGQKGRRSPKTHEFHGS